MRFFTRRLVFQNDIRVVARYCVALKYYIMFCFILALVLPQYVFAATVDYSSGSDDYVFGNPLNEGDAAGIGGTGTVIKDNSYASGNTVTVSGGMVGSIRGGIYYAYSILSNAESNNNTVNIEETFSGAILEVYGGNAIVDTGNYAASVSGNIVNIQGGNFIEVYGGRADAKNGLATATNNSVNFTAGSAGNIYGGYAEILQSANSFSVFSSGNSVNISGGAVGAVYGGLVDAPFGIGQAVNNTVTISGSPDLTSARGLWWISFRGHHWRCFYRQ